MLRGRHRRLVSMSLCVVVCPPYLSRPPPRKMPQSKRHFRKTRSSEQWMCRISSRLPEVSLPMKAWWLALVSPMHPVPERLWTDRRPRRGTDQHHRRLLSLASHPAVLFRCSKCDHQRKPPGRRTNRFSPSIPCSSLVQGFPFCSGSPGWPNRARSCWLYS